MLKLKNYMWERPKQVDTTDWIKKKIEKIK